MDNLILYATIIWLIPLGFCCSASSSDDSLSEVKHQQKQPTKDTTVIDNAIGMVVKSETYQLGDTICIWNEGRTAFDSRVMQYEREQFRLKCLSVDGGYYKIMRESGEIGWISKEEPIEFQTWEQHILTAFAVDFDTEQNPLRTSPNDTAEMLTYQNESHLPRELKGEWLKVEWEHNGKTTFGWIKWHENGKLLVTLSYSC